MGKLRSSAEWRLFGALDQAAPAMHRAWWALVVGRALLPAAFALAMGSLVSAVQDGSSLAPGLAGVAVVFVLLQTVGPFHDVLSTNLGERVTCWLQDRLLTTCLSPAGIAHLEDPETADQLALARDFDRGMTGPDITASMPRVAGGFALFGGGLAQALLLFGYRWWAPIVVGGGWLTTHHFLKKGSVWHGRMDPEAQELSRKADYAYRLTVDAPAAKELRLFGLADWIVGGFIELRRSLLDRSWEARRLTWKVVRWAVLAVLATNAFYFWRLAVDAVDGRFDAGQLVVFAQAAIGASALAFAEWDWWFRTAAQPIPVVLDLVERVDAAGGLPAGTRPADGLPAAEIRLDHVSFTYPRATQPVFTDLDLTIPAGGSLAIVGRNGAGKTTLAKLLCRLYDPTEGRILVDGVPLMELDVGSWRSRLAAVFQDFVRYELPLRRNVAPAGAPDDIVHAALTMAGAADLAELDQVLSKAYAGGTDLSGGQWQRVAIARALAAVAEGAGVVLLDEPTAHLDVRAESEIFERVLESTRGCTTILISHRFATVRRADLICVVEHGAVVELGSHDELMAAGGRYRTMFDLQAARFDDPTVADEDVELDEDEVVA